MRWPANRWGGRPIKLSCGHFAGWRMCLRRAGPGQRFGASRPVPLVNVGLLPMLSVAVLMARRLHFAPDAYLFTLSLWWIDLILLLFNMLPIYPLDGGQIFQSCSGLYSATRGV